MTWTAKVRDLKKHAGNWEVQITYTNGTEQIHDGFSVRSFDLPLLKQKVRNEVNRLNALDVEQPPVDIGDDIDLTPPVVSPPTPPTQAQKDRKTWSTKWSELNSRLKAQNAGLVIPQNDNRIAVLQTQLSDTIKAEYVDIIR